MGSTERRERERTEIRTKILNAAREMFAESGVEAVTMRAIAERIEYTPTAIYHHFKDKHALLTELCAVDFEALVQKFDSIGRIDDPIERLRALGRAYVEFALEHPSQYRFMFMTPKLPLEGSANGPAEKAYGYLRDSIAEAVRAGRYRPELDDPELLAQIAWAAVHGVVSLHITMADRSWIAWRDPKETAAAMCEALILISLQDPLG